MYALNAVVYWWANSDFWKV
ncbi:hypothetical protein AZE42_08190 [Rhizopogon vesiculosus]|uniref:Uncharacterized protein n=1 Tax=Rhizopogon vesiculosus TaxID=180088 RepID=A0A1J8RG31_9AGAM|nr:hypothetical protein AZE42_08190 [Rhizopogon vesiculosus]